MTAINVKSSVKVGINPSDQIRKLSNALKNKSMRIALSAGSAPVKAATQSQAPSRYGFLAKAQRIRIRSYQGNQVWVSVVGATRAFVRSKGKVTRGENKGKAIKHRPAFYQHLIESGTKYFSGRHFMAAAKAASKQQFAQVCTQRLAQEIAAVLAV